jgi:hypothetical protein
VGALADREEYGCCSFGFDSGETGENSKKAANGGIVLWNWGKPLSTGYSSTVEKRAMEKDSCPMCPADGLFHKW